MLPSGLDLRIRDVPYCYPLRRSVPHFFCNEAEDSVSHFRHIAETLQVIVIVRRIKSKKIRCNHRILERVRPTPQDLWWSCISLRELTCVCLKESLGGGEVFRIWRTVRKVSVMERLFSKLGDAIKADNRTCAALLTLRISNDFGFALHCAELRIFAVKISQTVEATVKNVAASRVRVELSQGTQALLPGHRLFLIATQGLQNKRLTLVFVICHSLDRVKSGWASPAKRLTRFPPKFRCWYETSPDPDQFAQRRNADR